MYVPKALFKKEQNIVFYALSFYFKENGIKAFSPLPSPIKGEGVL